MNRVFPILLDVDMVLLDWCKGFHNYMTREGFEKKFTTTYDLAHSYPGIDTTRYVEAFSHDPDYMKLDMISGARLGVADLARRYPDCPIIAVTCCGTHPDVIESRARKLRVFNLNGLVALGTMASKEKVFQTFNRGMVIEDSPKQIVAAAKAGHLVITFDQPYNQAVPSKLRAMSWGHLMGDKFHASIQEFI